MQRVPGLAACHVVLAIIGTASAVIEPAIVTEPTPAPRIATLGTTLLPAITPTALPRTPSIQVAPTALSQAHSQYLSRMMVNDLKGLGRYSYAFATGGWGGIVRQGLADVFPNNPAVRLLTLPTTPHDFAAGQALQPLPPQQITQPITTRFWSANMSAGSATLTSGQAVFTPAQLPPSVFSLFNDPFSGRYSTQFTTKTWTVPPASVVPPVRPYIPPSTINCVQIGNRIQCR